MNLKDFEETKLGQLLKVCDLAIQNKIDCGRGVMNEGITVTELKNLYGIDRQVIEYLLNNHYCCQRKNQKWLWFATNGNKYYPNNTIQNLREKVVEFMHRYGEEEEK